MAQEGSGVLGLHWLYGGAWIDQERDGDVSEEGEKIRKTLE
jgi:hypothetical protein